MKSRNQQELLKFLGPEYSIVILDSEPCIYRRLNDHYDIEISRTYYKRTPMSVYVWNISKGTGTSAVTVESHQGINDRQALKDLLDCLVEKYQN